MIAGCSICNRTITLKWDWLYLLKPDGWLLSPGTRSRRERELICDECLKAKWPSRKYRMVCSKLEI